MTQTLDRRPLDELLAIPLSVDAGRCLLHWARSLYGRIAQGDMMIGILSPDEARRAPEALTRAIDCGIDEAWLDLASWLTTPPIDMPDYSEAERVLRLAIQAGVRAARLRLVELRWFYQRENASNEQRSDAIHLLQEALRIDGQDSDALHLLGLLTCQGFGTPADPKAAFRLQRRAAELGNSKAQFELYVHFTKGLGVPQDDRAAFRAVTLAANAGHPRALYNLGAFYATGKQVPKDLKMAAEWYEKAFDAGNVQAAIALAVMYATGDGVEKNLEYANELFGQAEWLGYDVSEVRSMAGLPP